MSIAIAQDTVRLALDAATAQMQTAREIALAREVAALKAANAGPEAALQLLDASLESLGSASTPSPDPPKDNGRPRSAVLCCGGHE